ncbi:Hypothetical protein, putative [Bodo saltans]|uniref:Uncharacterized protein n=1 Tax=Bodo saltans TaxID=75058 RepID=A0A0S4JKS5_BODSA|nr:Hypothetical protein, putative [Bodo saltans]|eukprot:CUG91200.1 Hypothetical protein, putative [Bodo saltans]
MSSACDVIPGDCVGEIVLGAPLIVVADRLNENKELYGIIRVDDGSSSSPHPQAVSLKSERRKMSFLFHRTMQTLEKIVVENLSTTELTYRSTPLSGPGRATTFAHVYDVLGPTFQGSMNTESGLYRLRYPGIEVDFPIPPQYHQEFMARGTHPTKLPDGSIPVAVSITVLRTPGSDPNSYRDVPYAKGKVLAGDDVFFSWPSKELLFVRSQTKIGFGASPQDVMRQLGCSPRSVYNLLDNRMHIHSTGTLTSAATAKGGSIEARLPMYCFNYPLLGVDFIFNGDHRLEKVMLHNPLPWHDTFLKYQRCNYTIKGPWELVPQSAETLPPQPEHLLTNAYRWSDEDDAYAESRGVRPLISSTHCSNGLVLKIYAFAGIVLYVMPAQQKVVKVLLFEKAAPMGSSRGSATRFSPIPPQVEADPQSASTTTAVFVEEEFRDETLPVTRTSNARLQHVDPMSECRQQGASLPPPALAADLRSDEELESMQVGEGQTGSTLSGGGASPSLRAREQTVAYSPSTHDVVEEDDDGDERHHDDDDGDVGDTWDEMRKARDAADNAEEEPVDDGYSEAEVEDAATAVDDDNDDSGGFSVPPPMPALVSHEDGDDDDDGGQHDRYTDDFEESSRHHSARSSWAQSAHRSPMLPPQTAASEELSDDRWGPTGEEDSLPEPVAPPVDEADSRDEDEEPSGTPVSTRTPGSPSPASAQGRGLTPSPANRSGTSATSATSISNKSKKNKKKKR